ncbi:hypothetical protein [Verrucomicrobium sp. BvORR106]|uniref:hypothetical protein n=1 Tax=Verrucomicrobium sp. BvORR106 TaxID=1403819 RepID=UPI0005703097|nr:hypothetical protein [Verrucomicrobium sp. BvORR106]
MKFVAIIITLVLFGGMGYLMMDARNQAKGVTNELELIRRQQAADQAERAAERQAGEAPAVNQIPGATGKGKRPAPTPEQLAAAARESEALVQGAATSIPTMPPGGTIGAPAPGAPGTPGAPGLAAVPGAPPAPVAPLPPTPRQRQVVAAPAIAKVSEVQLESGFVIISSGSGRKIEKGMPFAIRRGDAIVGRVKVTLVEEGNAVADIVRESVPVGVSLQQGDDVIQDLPPL